MGTFIGHRLCRTVLSITSREGEGVGGLRAGWRVGGWGDVRRRGRQGGCAEWMGEAENSEIEWVKGGWGGGAAGVAAAGRAEG